jgi:hypothetical protein
MLIFPAADAFETKVCDQILALFERSFECEHAKMIGVRSRECCDLHHHSV